MKAKHTCPVSIFALLMVAASSRNADALSITLDFSGFGTNANWAALNNDAWSGSTVDAEKRAAAETVVSSAAAYWEAAYAASSAGLSVTINVGWGALGGSAQANGGASWFDSPPDYPFSVNTLTFDNDGSSTFFTDLTPWENSEWGRTSERDVDFGGGAINAERVFYNAPTSGAAFNNADMLTVSLHEIGHALGLLGAYPRYAALDSDSDGDLDLSDGSEIPYSVGHLTYSLPLPPSGFPADGFMIGGTYYPALMGPSAVQGTRKLLTAADIQTLAAVHGFDNLNTDPSISPVPEPTAGLLLFAAGLIVLGRRRRA